MIGRLTICAAALALGGAVGVTSLQAVQSPNGDVTQMMFDPAVGKVVVWLATRGSTTDQRWAWDGTAWARLEGDDPPTR